MKRNFTESILRREDAREDSVEACKMLAKLYKAERPLAAWAFALKAIRLGAKDVRAYQYFAEVSPGSDYEGAYLLGRELVFDDRFDEAIPFLEAAAYATNLNIAGVAALYLADLLSHSERIDRNKIDALYRRAAVCGNPDVHPCFSASV